MMKGNTFIPGLLTRYGPIIDWGCTLQIAGNGTLGISRTNSLHLWFSLMVIWHIDAGSTKATYLNLLRQLVVLCLEMVLVFWVVLC
jgi:hypothetical protein